MVKRTRLAVATIDPTTGLPCGEVSIFEQTTKGLFKEFTMENKIAIRQLRAELTNGQYLFMCDLINNIEWENIIPTTQASLAEKLKIGQQHITNLMRVMRTKGIATREKTEYGHYVIALDPQIIWKGKAEKHWQAVTEWQTKYNVYRDGIRAPRVKQTAKIQSLDAIRESKQQQPTT